MNVGNENIQLFLYTSDWVSRINVVAEPGVDAGKYVLLGTIDLAFHESSRSNPSAFHGCHTQV